MVNDVPPGVRRNLPPTAALRVFSPLRAFDDAEQADIRAQRPASRVEMEIVSRRNLLARATREVTDPFPHDVAERYRVLHRATDEGTMTLYCPEQLPARTGMAEGMLEQEFPPALLRVMVPATAAGSHSERMQEHELFLGERPLHTRIATWGIPLAWFAALREDDTEEVDDEDGVVTSVRLSAPLVQVVERLAHAEAIVARAAPELPLLAEIGQLRSWVARFHPDSAVELDYGLLADFVWPDDSPRDLREGLDCLDEGDLLGGAAAHRRLVTRWNRVRVLGRSG